MFTIFDTTHVIDTNTYCLGFIAGIYVCSNCGNELFHSQTKYEHSSPWPAFTHLIREDSVSRVKESATAIKVSRRDSYSMHCVL